MARTETIVQVFLASPSDCADERRALDEVITELNGTWARNLAVRLELWRWETDGYPGVGPDPQQVINSEAPPDYDIFVGIMWGRFGTATPRAGSGTEEEFKTAKTRHEAAPTSPAIMFYFKNKPLPLSELDLDQLARVKAFRTGLGEEGVLYWTFDSTDQFRNLARVHLSKQVQAWLARQKVDKASGGQSVQPHVLAPPTQAEALGGLDEDQGLFDLLDTAQNAMRRMTDVSGRIAQTVSSLGERIAVRTAALNGLDKTDPGYLQAIRRNSTAVAEDLDEFTARISVETPSYVESLHVWMESLSKGAAISLEFSNSSDNLRAAALTLSTVKETIRKSGVPTREFRNTLARTPRLTTIFNKARRRAVDALDALLAAFDDSVIECEKTEMSIRSLLPPDQASEGGASQS